MTVTIYYQAITATGYKSGVAVVPVPPGRGRPSWSDCRKAIPGFFTGRMLAGPTPQS